MITNAPRVSGISTDSLLSAIVNNKTKLQTSIQYSDGLGRIIQTVQEQATTKGYDMVMPQAYDQYSREVKKYLPYAPETGTAGSFRHNAVSTDQNAFYTTLRRLPAPGLRPLPIHTRKQPSTTHR